MDVIIATISLTTTFLLLVAFFIALSNFPKIRKNKVHFYVARDKNSELLLYMGKPFRGIDKFHPCQNGCIITNEDDFSNFGLNKDDYDNLKWEDDSIEVFINIKD